MRRYCRPFSSATRNNRSPTIFRIVFPYYHTLTRVCVMVGPYIILAPPYYYFTRNNLIFQSNRICLFWGVFDFFFPCVCGWYRFDAGSYRVRKACRDGWGGVIIGETHATCTRMGWIIIHNSGTTKKYKKRIAGNQWKTSPSWVVCVIFVLLGYVIDVIPLSLAEKETRRKYITRRKK